MNVSARPGPAGPEAKPRTLSDATVRAAGGWVSMLARTLKTCRLYDASNPTVVRFREELAQSTQRLLEQHGALAFHFTQDDVTCDGVSLYPARSRDDNLAYPFHRDGIRGITLRPGFEERELSAMLDCLLASGGNLDGDDLVTLLWEADLRHVDVDYIPSEGDVGASGPGAAAEGESSLLPWPSSAGEEPEPAPAEGASGAATGRSEDWLLGDLTVEVEACFVELDSLAPVETERFRHEFTEEHLISPVTAALAIATACLHANVSDADRQELGHFLPRVLRGALAIGGWSDAREALRALRTLESPEWNEVTFVQELLQPVSVLRIVERLDRQDEESLAGFMGLTHEVGDPGIDLQTLVLCESQQRLVRQTLAEAIAARCHDHPERLAPWLNDQRWYVVRNMAHILGWIGGPSIVPLLQVALRHPDARVHAEVVAALAQLDLKVARPLLVRALDGADSRLFCQILGQLSVARDPATARFLFAFIQQERFPQRPPEERRAIYAAVASVGGDELVGELEAELLKGNWFDRTQEIHRQNIARCLARIGTAGARAALERAVRSPRAPVRQAAQLAVASMREAA